eukprot:123397_1
MGRGKGGRGLGQGGTKRLTKGNKIIVSDLRNSDPCINVKRTRDQLLSWVKVNHIKQNLNNEILSVCIPSILKLFGSNADLLQYLTMYSSKPKLDEMYQIIHQTIQQFQASNKPIRLTNVRNSNPLHRYFAKISDESVVNICSFLLKREILAFKKVSRRISIICLNEMNKYCISICLAQHLLYSKHLKVLKWEDKMSLNRYHNATTYSYIFQYQQQVNNFAEHYQVPIVFDKNTEYQ